MVSGSVIGTMPVSSSTVATQIELEPDIGGVSSGSMMMKPIVARGSFGGTSRLTWRKTPPRGSLRTKLRSVWSSAMKRRCSQSVSPGGGATPPTITSPDLAFGVAGNDVDYLAAAHSPLLVDLPVLLRQRGEFQPTAGQTINLIERLDPIYNIKLRCVRKYSFCCLNIEFDL